MDILIRNLASLMYIEELQDLFLDQHSQILYSQILNGALAVL